MARRLRGRACRQGMACSADTIVRLVRRAALPAASPIKVLGVDEWAWRKGQSYGIMLVDLERHVPVDVLPDAAADSFAAWLKAHPGIELITRDRAGVFADGAASGAPNAMQIADRWHILRNLSEELKKVLARHHDSLKRAFTPQPEQQEPQAAPAPVVISHTERIRQSRRSRRLARYQEVRQLYEQGWSFASTARMLGMNKKTVAKFVQAEQFPEARPRGDRRRKQWEAGQHNAAKLHRDIQVQECAWLGNDDPCLSLGTARPDRTSHRAPPPFPGRHPEEISLAAQRSFESSGDLADLESAGEASEEQRRQRDLVLEAHPEVTIACLLAQALDPWIEQALDSAIPELGSFVGGIRRDQSAVFNALSYPWNRGQVEGQIHRLKLLKRQSYGQAGFDLLRHRVLARSA